MQSVMVLAIRSVAVTTSVVAQQRCCLVTAAIEVVLVSVVISWRYCQLQWQMH